ncbi:MAG: hypothetical protein U0703_02575 [Anaerolineae bacterium]
MAATVLLFLGQRNDSPILSLIGITITIINAVIVGLGAQSYMRTSSDLRGGRVATVSGVVSHTIRVSGRVATYVLKLDGQEIIVSKPVFFAVEDARLYRLYRAPPRKPCSRANPAGRPAAAPARRWSFRRPPADVLLIPANRRGTMEGKHHDR